MQRVFAILGLALSALALGAYSSTIKAQTTDVSSGSFVFLSSAKSCPYSGALTCYLDDPVGAAAVVTELKQAGGYFFLLPSATSAQTSTMGSAISAQGGKFLTYEEWAWKAASTSGQFNCDQYTNNRIIPDLLPLKAAYPDAFYGFQLVDEPATPEHQSLGQLKACLMSQPAFAGMKVFLNLAPLNANDAALNIPGSAQADAMQPAEYGVDCTSNALVSRDLAASMVNKYTAYVLSALDNIAPDVLAFDLYPFTAQFDSCSAARDLVMSENMSIISSQAIRRNITPVAYLQNVRASPLVANPSPTSYEYANFYHLRWFSSWSFVFGGRGFANFVSHDVDDKTGSPQFEGLLTADNKPRDLLGDQQSTYGMTRQVESALVFYPFQQFVAPFLGVSTGSIVGWMPSNDLMTGEYGNVSDGQVMLFVARRPMDSTVTATLGLNRWWVKIEKLNFTTGVWEVVGRSTNAIDVNLGSFPGALFRLSSQP